VGEVKRETSNVKARRLRLFSCIFRIIIPGLPTFERLATLFLS
jgi:hypothetical protein